MACFGTFVTSASSFYCVCWWGLWEELACREAAHGSFVSRGLTPSGVVASAEVSRSVGRCLVVSGALEAARRVPDC